MSFDLKVNDKQRQPVFQLQLIMTLCLAMILLALFVQNGFFSEKCSPKSKSSMAISKEKIMSHKKKGRAYFL